eukprot:7805195-Pyramimonas_sp.AAC.1
MNVSSRDTLVATASLICQYDLSVQLACPRQAATIPACLHIPCRGIRATALCLLRCTAFPDT